MSEELFKFGDKIIKDSGDYTFEGTVVAVFTKKSGAIRYVIEDARGLLLIMSAKQLKPWKSS